MKTIFLKDEQKTLQLGTLLSTFLNDSVLIYLCGELGAGKTTLVRGFLRGLGYTQTVKSPTYTLIEPYTLKNHKINHLDLYRIEDPQELEWIGIREYLHQTICFVEWPERGHGVLPIADITVDIHLLDEGRNIALASHSPKGEEIVLLLYEKLRNLA